MKIFRFDEFDLYISVDALADHKMYCENTGKRFSRVIDDTLNMLVFRSLSRDMRHFMEMVAKHSEQKIAVLHGHGDAMHDPVRKGRLSWVYQDGREQKYVQQWIDRYDGKYSCLVLCLCNPGHLDVDAKESLLLIPDRIISGLLVEIGDVSWSFRYKGMDIDDNTARYEADILKH